MMCGCNKHREAAARVAEENGFPRVARVIRKIPTHDERKAWLKNTTTSVRRAWTEPDYSRTPGKDRVLASPHGERKP